MKKYHKKRLENVDEFQQVKILKVEFNIPFFIISFFF